MTDGKPGVMVRWDTFTFLQNLPAEDAKRLIVAVGTYAKEGIEPDFSNSPVLPVLWSVIAERIKADDEKYSSEREKKREAINKRWSKERGEKEGKGEGKLSSVQENTCEYSCKDPVPSTSTSTSASTYSPEDNALGGKAAKNRFSPPSVDEVREYCRERGNSVDPERFVDFYISKGWKVGNQQMKDWRAAVRTWEKTDGRGTAPTSYGGYDVDELFGN